MRAAARLRGKRRLGEAAPLVAQVWRPPLPRPRSRSRRRSLGPAASASLPHPARRPPSAAARRPPLVRTLLSAGLGGARGNLWRRRGRWGRWPRDARRGRLFPAGGRAWRTRGRAGPVSPPQGPPRGESGGRRAGVPAAPTVFPASPRWPRRPVTVSVQSGSCRLRGRGGSSRRGSAPLPQRIRFWAAEAEAEWGSWSGRRGPGGALGVWGRGGAGLGGASVCPSVRPSLGESGAPAQTLGGLAVPWWAS